MVRYDCLRREKRGVPGGKPYWEKRLLDYEAIKRDYAILRFRQFLVGRSVNPLEYPRGFTHVRFRRGYTNTAMVFPIVSITIGIGKPDMGAPIDRAVFIIKFGVSDETRNNSEKIVIMR